LLRYKIISATLSAVLLLGAFSILPAQIEAAQVEYARSTVDILNVRTEPDISSSVIRKIGTSYRYEVLDKKNDWVKIQFSDKSVGWIYQEYVEFEQAESTVEETVEPIIVIKKPTVVNIIDITNLRDGASVDRKIVGKAQPGEKYPIVGTEGDWYIITLPNKSTAYVASWVVTTDLTGKGSGSIKPPTKGENYSPILYIYHTHNRESWKNVARNKNGSSVDDKDINITLVGKQLGQLLEKKGISTLVEEEDFTDRLQKEKLAYSQAYSVSRRAIDSARKDNPSLAYFFDIHRDSDVPRNITTVTIDGKTYARVLFVIGTGHPRYKENKELAEAMSKLLNEKYPGISRGVLTKSASQGNGQYNQNVSTGSLLLEVGGVNNNLQESLHSSEALADVFAQYLNL